ncbi:MAG: hypothetical protein U9P71_08710 [Campylobacterota bacterium]|nr:hypothetical protein [Campylobacterota bacterium]
MSEQLKDKIFKAQSEGDIASLFMLEKEAHESFDEEMLHAYYANILDLALERLTDALEGPRKMDFDDVQDFATIRALYEYAIEHYSSEKLNDASALFEVLSGISNSTEFSNAMKIHVKAINEAISLDDFIEKIADVDATEASGTFYLSKFQEAV